MKENDAFNYFELKSEHIKLLADDHHTHGSDLADGELNDETMFAILQDIVSYELVDK